MSNPTGKGGFQERRHQINRKGRPKNYQSLSELARMIGYERAITKGGGPLLINGRPVTVVEAILRQMASSINMKDKQKFIEIGWGKTPEHIEMVGDDGKPIEINLDYKKDMIELIRLLNIKDDNE